MSAQHLILLALVCAVGAGCSREPVESNVEAPGRDRSAKTKVLEAGAALLQGDGPLSRINAYLDGFHFYNGNMQSQMEAHHYCGHLNDDVIQCVIYDGNRNEAKLMGIEYIISKPLFDALPAEEKHLWHSHVHEVKSGQLIAPGIPQAAEHELMEKLVSTYGKTWHTWHTDKHDRLPVGGPMLMMGFTRDGQADEKMVSERDRRFNISSAERRTARADIQSPAVDPEADAWQKDIVLQAQIAEQNEKVAARSQ